MNMNFSFVFIAIFLYSFTFTLASDSPCGDWIPYKDEKCFKVIDDTLRTFADAEKSCAHQENSPSLAIIRTQEEQDFLTTLLFKTQKKVDNVWLGARVDHNRLSWIDHSNQSFTNWRTGSPKNKPNYCVMMEAEETVMGKWVDEPCEKKNLVLCEKMQTWSTAKLANILLDARSEFRDGLAVLTKENVDSKKQTAQLEHALEESRKEISNLKQNLIPLGFTYFQLPKDKSPRELWPSMTWTDVSADYSGVFFRVEGTGAASFGTMQEDNSPRLEKVYGANGGDLKGIAESANEVEVKKGQSSIWMWSGDWAKEDVHPRYMRFVMSGGEVRPRNMAIRVWKRTG